MLTNRLASAAVGLPVLIGAVWLGGPWFAGLVFIAGAIAMFELVRLMKIWGHEFHNAIPFAGMMVVLIYGLMRALNFGGENDLFDNIMLAITDISALLICPVAGWALGRQPVFNIMPSTGIMIIRLCMYLGVPLYYALQIRFNDDGREWVLLILITVFATDTCAYVVGRLIGKTPFASSISPNKTREGAIAGLCGAVAASVAANSLLGLNAIIWQAAALGLFIGVFGQLGDLAESRMKRKAGVKDSGFLIPGHGGMLDRLDSILYVLPGAHLFITWVVQGDGFL